MIRFDLDLAGRTFVPERHWEFAVGSCHAATALREDYRRQLREARRELGFRYLRFHGLFDDDMCVLRKPLFGDGYILSFTNVDNIFDFLLSIGMKPFVEIGFMPEALSSGPETIFHYKGNVTPPKDEKAWIYLIDRFVRHLIDRYGRDEVRSWFFEIWNEPNLSGEYGVAGGRFWSGTLEQYFRLYEITAGAIKAVDARLKVGGPATSNNAHIPDMIAFCRKNNVPIDFVSTHHYPTDVVLGYGVEDSQNFVKAFNDTDRNDADAMRKLANEYLTFQQDIWTRVERGVLTDMAKRAAKEAEGLPLYYTEWSSLAGLESDGPFGASFAVKTVLDNIGLVKGYSYWTFTDIFEEKGMPSAAFHGGFGLMTLAGVKKAPYRAFELLHKLFDEKYEKTFSDGTVDAYAFRSAERGAVQILVVNHNSLLHPIETQRVRFELSGADLLPQADMVRVDADHANALAEWERMGRPEYIDLKQLAALEAASQPAVEHMTLETGCDKAAIELDLGPQSVTLLTTYQR